MERRRVVVRGEVQGVGYRWSARERAAELGVSGFVQNLPDGSVLAEVSGKPAAVDAMVAWMRSGPPGARVASVETSEIVEPAGDSGGGGSDASATADFDIRR